MVHITWIAYFRNLQGICSGLTQKTMERADHHTVFLDDSPGLIYSSLSWFHFESRTTGCTEMCLVNNLSWRWWCYKPGETWKWGSIKGKIKKAKCCVVDPIDMFENLVGQEQWKSWCLCLPAGVVQLLHDERKDLKKNTVRYILPGRRLFLKSLSAVLQRPFMSSGWAGQLSECHMLPAAHCHSEVYSTNIHVPPGTLWTSGSSWWCLSDLNR